MDVERCEDSGEWRRLVEAAGGPAFVDWDWGAVSEQYGADPIRLVATVGDDVVGGLPLVSVGGRPFGTALVSMPFSEYGGPLLVGDDGAMRSLLDEARRSLLDEATAIADDRGVDYLCLRGVSHPGTDDYLRFTRYVTFRVDATGTPADAWEGLETRFRTAVRNARGESLSIERGSSREVLEPYYDMHRRTMRGHGSPPHARRFFEALWDRFADAGDLEVWIARLDGDPVNGALFLPYGDVVHYWGAVSDPSMRHLDGGSLLLWRVVEWACDRDYRTVDLGRTRPGSPVFRFKSSLGGRLLHLDDLYYYPGRFVPPPDPEDDAFRPLVAVWRRLPLAVIDLIGPAVRGRIP